MLYSNLGSSGLQVSTLSIGTMDMTEMAKLDEYCEIISEAVKAGINCIETAEAYGEKSVGQEILGLVLKKLSIPREEIIIKLKIFYGAGLGAASSANSIGLSRKRVFEGVKQSLKRLQLDYADVVYLQKYDNDTQLSESCKALHDLIEKGYCFYWGTIKWTADQIRDAIRVCENGNLHKPIVEETEYNLVKQDFFNRETLCILKKFNRKAVGYSPWDGGNINRSFQKLLYRKNRTFEWDQSGMLVVSEEEKVKTIDFLTEIKEISDDLNISLEEFALSWALKSNHFCSIVLEVSKATQLREALKSLKSTALFTPEVNRRIAKVSENFDGFL